METESASATPTALKRAGTRKLSLRNHIMLTTALTLPVALLGYGNRAAYGGACVPGGGIYACSGAASAPADMTQTLNAATVTVTTQPGFGIDTTTNGGDAFDLDATTSLTFTDNNASDITGAAEGIDAVNTGTGAISITTSGTVIGTAGRGIFAQTINGASTDLSVTATGAVTGTIGINAVHAGTGMLSVTAASVTGTAGRGIDAQTFNIASSGLSVTAIGTVTSNAYGIYAHHRGTGLLSVNAASVNSTGTRGIDAQTFNANSTGLSVAATGAVTGVTEGIVAQHSGTGMLSVNAASVTGTTGRGLFARTLNGASTGLSVTTTGAVTGDNDGIYAVHQGTGLLSVTAASVTSDTREGIEAITTNANSTDLIVMTTGAVNGGTYGISASHAGTGMLSVNATSVDGALNRGLFARTLYVASTGLSVTTTGAVTGRTDGIYARHVGTGMLSVNAASVTSDTSIGIFARTFNANSTGLSVTATGAVSGQNYGIIARHAGTGMLSVNAASVSGTTARGIFAYNNNAASTGLSVTATGAVSGSTDGIFAFHAGTGMVSVNIASVTGTGANGINARSTNADSTGLSVTATGAVTGGTYGIFAQHAGTGMLSVNVASVTGTTVRGIYARTLNGASTGLSVTATGDVTGRSDGIYARHDGTGMLSVNAASVTGTTGTGLFARALNGASTGLSVTTTGAVTGNNDGIYARHDGTGMLSVNAASVTGTTGRGLFARTLNGASTGLSVTTTGDVTGGSDGIYARHDGTGMLTVNAASVTSDTSIGIFARTFNANSTDLIVMTTGAVTGGTYGIFARHDGTGMLTVNAASVTSDTATGIFAQTNAASTGLSVTATGAVTGDTYGINALHLGTGALTIEAAAVTSTTGRGIIAQTNAASTGLSITATGDVTGDSTGIYSIHFGTGMLSVDTASVTGTGNSGIEVWTDNANSTGLSVTATGDVTGGTYGIYALHQGTGMLAVNAASVTGNTDRGIYARTTDANSTGLSVTATGAVTGGTDGIYARHAGAGGSTITVSGAVNGGQNGIGVNSPGANQITVQAGASVMGGTYGINTTVGAPGSADSVTLYGALNSNSVLGGGDDRLKIAATTTFGGGINVDAGDDTDVLELAGAGAGAFDLSTIGPAQMFRNFEAGEQSSGTWTASGTTTLPFNLSGGTLMGNPTFAGLTIGTGATIAPGNSIGTVTVNGNVVFDAGSIYQVEIDNTPASDLIDATGTAMLNGGTVEVTALSADNSFTSGTVFTILNADGGVTGTFAGVTDSSALLDYTLSYSATQAFLTLTFPTTVVAGVTVPDFSTLADTANQRAAASGLNGLGMTTGSDSNALRAILLGLNAEDARRAFDLSSGEVHASSQNVQQSASDLFSSALKRRAGLGAGAPSGIAVQALSFAPDVPQATFPAHVLRADAPRVSQEPGILQDQVQYGPSFAMWASVLGETGDIDGNSNAADLDNDAWGFAGGVDATWRTNAGALTAGLAAGFTDSDAAVSGRNSSVDADNYDIGLYAAFDTGRFRFSTAGSYAFQDLTTTRNIVFGSINRTADADYDGSVVSASAEAAYRIPLLAGDTVLSPLASFDYLRAHHESFTETGATALNLSGSSETFSTAESGLGLALEHVFAPTNGRALALQLRGQWKHNFGDTRADQLLTFAGAPTTPFTVTGVERDRDSLEVGAGLGLEINDKVSVSGRYEGTFFSGETSHRGQISLIVGLN